MNTTKNIMVFSSLFAWSAIVIETLLSVRLFLSFRVSDPHAPFFQLINMITEPLVAPFIGLFTHQMNLFDVTTLFALVIYSVMSAMVIEGLSLLSEVLCAKKLTTVL